MILLFWFVVVCLGLDWMVGGFVIWFLFCWWSRFCGLYFYLICVVLVVCLWVDYFVVVVWVGCLLWWWIGCGWVGYVLSCCLFFYFYYEGCGWFGLGCLVGLCLVLFVCCWV